MLPLEMCRQHFNGVCRGFTKELKRSAGKVKPKLSSLVVEKYISKEYQGTMAKFVKKFSPNLRCLSLEGGATTKFDLSGINAANVTFLRSNVLLTIDNLLPVLQRGCPRLQKLVLSGSGSSLSAVVATLKILADAPSAHLVDFFIDDGSYNAPQGYYTLLGAVGRKHRSTLKKFTISVYPRRNDCEPFQKIFGAAEGDVSIWGKLNELCEAKMGIPAHVLNVQSKDSVFSHLAYFAPQKMTDELLDTLYAQLVAPKATLDERAEVFLGVLWWATPVHHTTISRYLPLLNWIFPHIESIVARRMEVQRGTLLLLCGLLALAVAPHNDLALLDRLDVLAGKLDDVGSVVHPLMLAPIPNFAHRHSVPALLARPFWKERFLLATNHSPSVLFDLFHARFRIMGVELLLSHLDEINLLVEDELGRPFVDQLFVRIRGIDSTAASISSLFSNQKLSKRLAESLTPSRFRLVFAEGLSWLDSSQLDSVLSREALLLASAADDMLLLAYEKFADLRWAAIEESIPYVHGEARALPQREYGAPKERQEFVELVRQHWTASDAQGQKVVEDRFARFLAGKPPFVVSEPK